MKKKLIVCLCIIALLALTACGGTNNGGGTETPTPGSGELMLTAGAELNTLEASQGLLREAPRNNVRPAATLKP
jgi:hypothetical protein